ncbi:extracellular solute-binding protein [bacterium]|nr:extracellular solute-binding protein [bacterium]MDY3021835.1 extracellular solute-binding protein [Oliverpabstia sp.]
MRRKALMKAAALGMAAVMTVGMFAGCGSGSDSGKGDSGSSVELNDAGTYPIVKDGTLDMTIFTMSMPNVEDFATNDFTKFMEEKTGIHMDFVTGGRDDWEEKLNMLLQSDDYPDIIMGVSPNIAKYGVKEGIFIPLDDYLTEENVPNYLNVMKDFDLGVTRETDGKIYSLADINDCYHCKYARKMWVNTYYLDQMGCEVPTTTDEFIDVCKKFLEMKPDGIAVAGANEGWFTRMQDWLMGAYTFVPAKSETLVVRDYVALDTDTSKVTCVAASDQYKEGLKFINELYEIGAIYDGDFTQTSEQMKTLINQEDEPVLFFTAGTISDAIDSASNNELYRHYEAMAPIAGPDGTRIAWTEPNYGVSSGAVCITDNCENVEAALRWIDFFYSETGDLCSQYGPDEGTDWVLDPEGKVGLNGEPALYEVLNTYSAEAQNHDWQDVGIRVATESYRLGQAVEADVDPYSPDGLERLLFDATEELYEPYGANTNIVNLNELKITDEESTDVSTIAVEVEKAIEENSVAFMTGAKDIDAEWDTYIQDLDKAGLQTLLEMYQTAYDRSNSAE